MGDLANMAARSRVLIVDDDAALLVGLSALLQDEFDVVAASSIAAALSALDRLRFDALVADHRLPGGTGLDVLRYARELDVIVAGFVFTADPARASAQAAPTVRVLAKTVAPHVVVEAVRQAVAETRLVRG